MFSIRLILLILSKTLLFNFREYLCLPRRSRRSSPSTARLSHADVILRNLLTGYPGGAKPDLELVSVVTDQVPKNDMSRDLAKKHGFKICDTVADALTLGGKKLAVDGVLSIGEHGKYPTNDRGQTPLPAPPIL